MNIIVHKLQCITHNSYIKPQLKNYKAKYRGITSKLAFTFVTPFTLFSKLKTSIRSQ